jgi:hypothetical protein
MKALKIILIVIGSIIGIFIVFSVVYWLVNKQGVVEAYDVGNPEQEQNVLIASQGSSFKDALIESLVTHLKDKEVYIKVIDVTTLQDIKENEWNALVMIHTTENWKLQSDVKNYLDQAEDLGKVVLVTTSGFGEWRTKDYDIDVITSASRTEELPALIGTITTRLEKILQK